MKFNPDDPRLTAFALGELDEKERLEVEEQLRTCEESRRFVEETRALADQLGSEFSTEDSPGLAENQRMVLEAQIEKVEAGALPVSAAPKIRFLFAKIAVAAAVLLVATLSVFWKQSGSDEVFVADSVGGKLGASTATTLSATPRLSEEAQNGAPLFRNETKPSDDSKEKDGRQRGLDGKTRDSLESLGYIRVDPPKNLVQGKPSVLVLGDGPAESPPVTWSREQPKQGARVQLAKGQTEKKIQYDFDSNGGREALIRSSVGLKDEVVAEPILEAAHGGSSSRGGTTLAKSKKSGGTGGGGKANAPTKAAELGKTLRFLTAPPSSPDPSSQKASGSRRRKAGQAKPSSPAEGEESTEESLDFLLGKGDKDSIDPSTLARSETRGSTEQYAKVEDNPFVSVNDQPLSTLSADVDTASYSNVRRFLAGGRLPPPDAVRIEELLNYFSYDYEPPVGDVPFAAHVEMGECPWDSEHRLARIGLKGKILSDEERPAANLVFLIDVSGSMNSADKLPLLQKSLELLVQRLGGDDRVAIVVYASASGLALPSTTCNNKETILQSLNGLRAGGSTNGGQGIQLAYETAKSRFIDGGINRVIWCTDGDLNVGTTDQGSLVRLIEEKAKSNIFLTVLGFGTGNLKDSTLEQMADHGNGHYAYIDSLGEGRKVLVDGIGGTLMTIAKDVKIQVEFNPAIVRAYRLIGYENRVMAAHEFNDDKKDAGELGVGHTVTFLYEIVPAESSSKEGAVAKVDPLKYQAAADLTSRAFSGESMTVKLRYKEPEADQSTALEFGVTDRGADLSMTSPDFRFAASVASFGMLLRGSEHKGNSTFGSVLEMASNCIGSDVRGYRSDFLTQVQRAKQISGN